MSVILLFIGCVVTFNSWVSSRRRRDDNVSDIMVSMRMHVCMKRAVEARERVWCTSLVAPPLLHNSPALHFLHGNAYFYDELGMSPTNSDFDPSVQPG